MELQKYFALALAISLAGVATAEDPAAIEDKMVFPKESLYSRPASLGSKILASPKNDTIAAVALHRADDGEIVSTLTVWSLPKLEVLGELELNKRFARWQGGGPVELFDYFQDGEHLLVGAAEGVNLVWTFKSGKLSTFPLTWEVIVDPNDSRVLSLVAPTIKVYRYAEENGEFKIQLEADGDIPSDFKRVTRTEFLDAKHILIQQVDGSQSMAMLELPTFKEIWRLENVYHWDASKGGGLVVVQNGSDPLSKFAGSPNAQLWNLKTHSKSAEFRKSIFRSVLFADSDRILIEPYDYFLWVYTVPSPSSKVLSLWPAGHLPRRVAVSRDDKFLITQGGRSLHVFRAADIFDAVKAAAP